MNLSMRKAGKDKFEEDGKLIMALLKGLITYDNPSIRNYINGTLYSIIIRPDLKQFCIEFEIPNLLMKNRAYILGEEVD